MTDARWNRRGGTGSTMLTWVFLSIAVLLGLGYWKLRPKEPIYTTTSTTNVAGTSSNAMPVVDDFPISGEGHATKEVGIKAYLDPLKTHTRPSGPAKYVFVEDESLFFNDTAGSRIDKTTNNVWWEMPAGRYVIYPLGRDHIFFKWWQ